MRCILDSKALRQHETATEMQRIGFQNRPTNSLILCFQPPARITLMYGLGLEDIFCVFVLYSFGYRFFFFFWNDSVLRSYIVWSELLSILYIETYFEQSHNQFKCYIFRRPFIIWLSDIFIMDVSIRILYNFYICSWDNKRV